MSEKNEGPRVIVFLPTGEDAKPGEWYHYRGYLRCRDNFNESDSCYTNEAGYTRHELQLRPLPANTRLVFDKAQDGDYYPDRDTGQWRVLLSRYVKTTTQPDFLARPVAPKFKVGDWVRRKSDGVIVQIDGVGTDGYSGKRLDTGQITVIETFDLTPWTPREGEWVECHCGCPAGNRYQWDKDCYRHENVHPCLPPAPKPKQYLDCNVIKYSAIKQYEKNLYKPTLQKPIGPLVTLCGTERSFFEQCAEAYRGGWVDGDDPSIQDLLKEESQC